MLLIVAIVVAFLLLPWPLNAALIIVAGLCEIALYVFGVRYTRRRRASVGVESLVGMSAKTIGPLTPEGQVRVNGEIWRGRADREIPSGVTVRVRAVNGLTLEVE